MGCGDFFVVSLKIWYPSSAASLCGGDYSAILFYPRQSPDEAMIDTGQEASGIYCGSETWREGGREQ